MTLGIEGLGQQRQVTVPYTLRGVWDPRHFHDQIGA